VSVGVASLVCTTTMMLGMQVTSRHTHGKLPGVAVPMDCNRICYEAEPNFQLKESLSLF